MLRFETDYGFDDWRLPTPETWKKGYQKREHVKEFNRVIEGYREGLLSMSEALLYLNHEYLKGYAAGLEDANYPVPAIASPLDMIAAMPCGPVTDFIDIGYYGRNWK